MHIGREEQKNILGHEVQFQKDANGADIQDGVLNFPGPIYIGWERSLKEGGIS